MSLNTSSFHKGVGQHLEDVRKAFPQPLGTALHDDQGHSAGRPALVLSDIMKWRHSSPIGSPLELNEPDSYFHKGVGQHLEDVRKAFPQPLGTALHDD